MPNEQRVNIKKFYQNSAKPRNYVPNALVTSSPDYPPVMSGLMQINPETKDIWVSAGRELVSDWINITSGGGVSGTISIQDNGTPISAAATILNFVGATNVSGDPNVTITIPTGPVIFKDTKVGTAVANTLAVGVTYSRLIPANTVTPGSIIRISYRVKKDTLANTGPAVMAINIGTSYPTSSAKAYALINWSIVLPNAYAQLKREFVVDSITSITKYISNKKEFFDDSTEALTEEGSAINWTIDQTIYFTIQHIASAVDSAAGSFYCIEIY
jgi:hypothetical protein